MPEQDIIIGDRLLVRIPEGEAFWATCVATSARYVQVSLDDWPALVSVLRCDVVWWEWPGERAAV